MIKLSLVQKMTLTAMMLAVEIICTRLIGVYITPFVRLSLGPAILIFSSLLLGPIAGAIVGGAGDILGIIMMNPTGFSINPFITLSYTVMGCVPALLAMVTKKFRYKTGMPIFLYVTTFLIWIAVLVFSLVSDEINIFNNVYKMTTLAKVLIPVLTFVLFVGLGIAIYFLNRYFQKKILENYNICSPYEIAFISLLCEVVFILLINTMIKSLYFGVDFWVIFFPAAIVFFIDVPLNTFVVSFLLILANKTIKPKE